MYWESVSVNIVHWGTRVPISQIWYPCPSRVSVSKISIEHVQVIQILSHHRGSDNGTELPLQCNEFQSCKKIQESVWIDIWWCLTVAAFQWTEVKVRWCTMPRWNRQEYFCYISYPPTCLFPSFLLVVFKSANEPSGLCMFICFDYIYSSNKKERNPFEGLFWSLLQSRLFVCLFSFICFVVSFSPSTILTIMKEGRTSRVCSGRRCSPGSFLNIGTRPVLPWRSDW